ncbi:uncharacterized protein At3g27210-like isoform X2 [Malania oleifera]|nr:uncharacterized protein At3g27210-like isoform X2 [Malania oleifera]
MKLRLSFGSKKDKVVIPSPVKENNHQPISESALKGQWSPARPVTTTFRDLDSKEESFFDSQPWLESDCEDDFFSVNGDFTPSRGSTPVHQTISKGAPQLNKTLFEGIVPKPIPTPFPKEKKKLAELFRQSSGGDLDADRDILGNQNMGSGKKEVQPIITDLHPKSADGTPYASVANSVSSSERTTPNGCAKPEKDRSIRSMQCCLPSLVSTCSYTERRKRMSPAHSRG